MPTCEWCKKDITKQPCIISYIEKDNNPKFIVHFCGQACIHLYNDTIYKNFIITSLRKDPHEVEEDLLHKAFREWQNIKGINK